MWLYWGQQQHPLLRCFLGCFVNLSKGLVIRGERSHFFKLVWERNSWCDFPGAASLCPPISLQGLVTAGARSVQCWCSWDGAAGQRSSCSHSGWGSGSGANSCLGQSWMCRQRPPQPWESIYRIFWYRNPGRAMRADCQHCSPRSQRESLWTKSTISTNGCQDFVLSVQHCQEQSLGHLGCPKSYSAAFEMIEFILLELISSLIIFFSPLTVGNSSQFLVCWETFISGDASAPSHETPLVSPQYCIFRPVRLKLEYMRVSLIWIVNRHWWNRISICVWSLYFASLGMSLYGMVMF